MAQCARDRWEPISAEIQARVGFAPDAFSLSVYNAAWVGVLSAVEARNRPDLRRASFWTVAETGTRIDWVRTASYAGGRLVR